MFDIVKVSLGYINRKVSWAETMGVLDKPNALWSLDWYELVRVVLDFLKLDFEKLYWRVLESLFSLLDA